MTRREGASSFERCPGILFRYKWLILASVVLGFLAANGAAMMTAPRYTVSALVQTSDAQARETGVTAIQAGPTRSPADWQNLLRSFSVMEPVAVDQKMFVSSGHPEYPDLFDEAELVGDIRAGSYTLEVEADGQTVTIRDRNGAVVQRTDDRTEAGVPLGVRLNPDRARLRAGIEVPFHLSRVRDAARGLNGRLQVQTTGASAYMAVQYTSHNPDRAAEELNAVLESFIREATELTRARSDELSRTLADQLASAAFLPCRRRGGAGSPSGPEHPSTIRNRRGHRRRRRRDGPLHGSTARLAGPGTRPVRHRASDGFARRTGRGSGSRRLRRFQPFRARRNSPGPSPILPI
jgi:capsular polysaccharide biosynthesis protein